ncbi:MAG: dienelactone hydrolase family protein [Proteobacteria bacterium]|nr:dienelactone hydrolase family protein [Pseudomonadota bacterium]
MCEHDDFDEFAKRAALSRRRFGAMALGSGLVAMLPQWALGADATGTSAAGVATVGADVSIATPDGTADAYFVRPASGTHAAVLMWPDIFGLRPAFKGMATRLAGAGYAVLVVNPFYRSQKAPTAPEHADFSDARTRDALMSLAHSLSPATAATDAKAFVDFLDAQAAVNTKRKVGTMGYCMSGPIAFRTAAARADRIGAVATFHGGGLVTKDADSPHLLIAKTHARYLIAIAANDDEREPDAKRVLRESFDRAHLQAEVEVYAGTQHGWCPTDSHVYDHDQAEKAWSRMLALFGAGLA